MTPVKENAVLIPTPETATARPAATGVRPEDSAAGRPQPVALEVPVTVNGARTVEGSDKREPFSESSKTVLVFGNGAVIRLTSPVAAGQLLFLTNDKTKKEVVCQVVKSKNYRNVSGYVELEFTEPVVGFWGMRFPSDRVGASGPAVSPVASAGSSTPSVRQESKPSVVPASKSASPAIVPPPVAIAKSPASILPPVAAPIASPEIAETPRRRASDLRPAQPPQAANSKPAASTNPTDALKLETARLQEQLSSMLFSEAPATKTTQPASSAAENISKVLEIAKREPVQQHVVTPAKPRIPEIKSTLDTEEVKIPAWLEPLVRNAASSPESVQEVASSEAPTHELVPQEEALPPIPSAAAPTAEPAFGSSFLQESAGYEESAPRGSNKGLLIGVLAAGLVIAGGAGFWYFRPSVNAAPAAVTTTAANGPALSSPVPSTPLSATGTPASTKSPVGNNSASTPRGNNSPSNAQPTNASVKVPVAAENKNNSAQPHVSQPEPSQPKKPELGKVHLAAPMVTRNANQTADSAEIGLNVGTQPVTGDEGLGAGLVASGAKQPKAPAVPLPIGGDVKPARPLASVPPVYPSLAKSQHVSGDVRVDALIDANGRVTTMKIVSGPTLLHQAAKDALRQWKYQPATLDGKPVPMHLTVTIQFRLQ
jgi:protein TonB